MIRAYVRVSTKGQVDKFGLDSQISDIERFCASKYPGVEIVTYTEKGVSGTIDPRERPEMGRLISDLVENDIIVCKEVSRISRVTWHGSKFLNDMITMGVVVSCFNAPDAADSSSGAMIFHIMLAHADYERSNSIERQNSARKEKGKDGGYVAGPSPAWTKLVDGKPEIDREKIEKIKLVRRLISGGMIYAKIKEETGFSTGTISSWNKQLNDKNSEMSKAIEEK